MKKLKTSDIVFTVLVVALLVALAAAMPWPTLTEAAYEAHMDMMWF